MPTLMGLFYAEISLETNIYGTKIYIHNHFKQVNIYTFLESMY